ncbi:MAG: glycoside hydrolase family 97 C-terminal domain-containing protein, partial [Melioribacteraceae bacterium]
SPLQMAADLPENYERFPDAFQFIKDVAVDWDDSKYLEAEPGDFITVARKAKGKESWFVGAISDEQSRTAAINLSFLDKDKKYNATIYADAGDAHWERNPMAYKIYTKQVTAKDILEIKLAAGGGCAVSITPL